MIRIIETVSVHTKPLPVTGKDGPNPIRLRWIAVYMEAYLQQLTNAKSGPPLARAGTL